jgi:hypothetical protein
MIGTTSLAGIGAALSGKLIDPLFLAFIGALTSFLLAADNTFQWRARSDWNAKCKNGYLKLIRQLDFESKSEAEVSNLLSTFEAEMEEQYPVRARALRIGVGGQKSQP